MIIISYLQVFVFPFLYEKQSIVLVFPDGLYEHHQKDEIRIRQRCAAAGRRLV